MTVLTKDNRNLEEHCEYLQDRIEALKREVHRLNLQVGELTRQKLQAELAIAELLGRKA